VSPCCSDSESTFPGGTVTAAFNADSDVSNLKLSVASASTMLSDTAKDTSHKLTRKPASAWAAGVRRIPGRGGMET
jgi:hypothetical protein